MKLKFRLFLLILLSLVSLYFILSPFLMRRQGIVVSSVENSECTLKEGDLITSVLGQQVNNVEDFNKIVKGLKKGEHVTMVVNNGPGSCTAIADGYLGVNVTNVPSDRLKFGIELQGGSVITLKPEKDVSIVAEILRKRAKTYMIPEIQILVNESVIKVVTISPDIIHLLLEKGKFETKILENIEISNGTGDIPVGDNVYTVEVVGNSLKVKDVVYPINNTFQLEDIVFTVKNITNNSVVVEAKVFENKDVLRVFSSSLSYNSEVRTYQFNIPVEISEAATKRFNKILKNAPTYFTGRQTVVEGFLVFYLDGKILSSLIIPAEFTKQEIKQLTIVGFSPNLKEATETKQKVLAALEGGEMPTNVKIVSIDYYKPTMQNVSIMLIVISLLFFLSSTLIFSHFRYKNLKIGFVAVGLILSCVFVTFGIITFLQKILPAWVINFQTLLGLTSLLFVCMLYSFMSAENKLRKNVPVIFLFRKSINLVHLIDYLIATIIVVLLFTPLRFFAITLLIGFLFYKILGAPLYEERL
jgi:hypothetical protein